MVVHAAPGMDEAKVADIAVDKIKEHWGGQMEGTAAHAGD